MERLVHACLGPLRDRCEEEAKQGRFYAEGMEGRPNHKRAAAIAMLYGHVEVAGQYHEHLYRVLLVTDGSDMVQGNGFLRRVTPRDTKLLLLLLLYCVPDEHMEEALSYTVNVAEVCNSALHATYLPWTEVQLQLMRHAARPYGRVRSGNPRIRQQEHFFVGKNKRMQEYGEVDDDVERGSEELLGMVGAVRATAAGAEAVASRTFSYSSSPSTYTTDTSIVYRQEPGRAEVLEKRTLPQLALGIVSQLAPPASALTLEQFLASTNSWVHPNDVVRTDDVQRVAHLRALLYRGYVEMLPEVEGDVSALLLLDCTTAYGADWVCRHCHVQASWLPWLMLLLPERARVPLP